MAELYFLALFTVLCGAALCAVLRFLIKICLLTQSRQRFAAICRLPLFLAAGEGGEEGGRRRGSGGVDQQGKDQRFQICLAV